MGGEKGNDGSKKERKNKKGGKKVDVAEAAGKQKGLLAIQAEQEETVGPPPGFEDSVREFDGPPPGFEDFPTLQTNGSRSDPAFEEPEKVAVNKKSQKKKKKQVLLRFG